MQNTQQQTTTAKQGKVVTLPERPSAPVAQLAGECVMKHGEHSDEAAKELHTLLRRKHREFYDWMAERAMRQWCFEQIRIGRSRLRGQIAHAPKGRETTAIQGLDAGSLSALVGWYDWPLLNGKKLGDSTRSEIIEAAEKYERDGEVYMRRAGWLRLVANKLPSEDVIAREALTVDELQKLAVQARITGEASDGRA